MPKYLRTGLAIFALLSAGFIYIYRAEIAWTWRYLITPASTNKNETRLSGPLPPCPRCNVILVSLDTLRADRMDFLGSPRHLTPNLNRIAGQSVVFRNAFTNAFYTTPSHMTLFTSLYPATHQVEGKDMKLIRTPRSSGDAHVLDAKYKTMAEVLQSNGYHTYWDAPLHLKFFEFKEGFSRGFEHFAPGPFDRGIRFGHEDSAEFQASSLAPLKSASAAHPVFMFLHSYITHHPYIWRGDLHEVQDSVIAYTRPRLLRSFKAQMLMDPENLPHMLTSNFPLSMNEGADLAAACTNYDNMSRCFNVLSSEDRFWHAVGQFQCRHAQNLFEGDKRLRSDLRPELDLYKKAYDLGVRFMDQEVGEFWRDFQKSGAADNTIVILLSDHGEELFDNGEPSHSSFYDHTARVPLIIFHPKLKAPLVIDQMISLVDVMPTLLSMLQIPAPAQTQGHLPWTTHGNAVFGFALGNDYVRERNWKLIRLYDGTEQLFYLPLDPGEQTNLIDFKNPIVRSAYSRLVQERRNWDLEQEL